MTYFHLEGNHYVITHGFTKKPAKTPRNKIVKEQYQKQLTQREFAELVGKPQSTIARIETAECFR
ncbi:helix-turn-helix domain-containing protein [Levilactobacillus yonginensis]|uniref:helix-turn-helix domain-containing protein n=1 Tax=Levilactobacillus yonginensis TaxID=1054041 RepID=UPI00345CA861